MGGGSGGGEESRGKRSALVLNFWKFPILEVELIFQSPTREGSVGERVGGNGG